ncbi:hypothetical protein BDV27DRAFT_157741 [Aspergillus caelatus]|uniref:Heterokaryon incompatibility domain-containing protein n=1 Tax=Aspergillus caelatus TaxID=61420 RepID=A0A5N7A4Z6_9EURO|nr:uncharacterized protein BDV27DRAFT_157741 [Aspergillus caelatus]KAE8364508.1 hypothetical protein BDV27DRAFT_157741 [Aspergillus caelatus]
MAEIFAKASCVVVWLEEEEEEEEEATGIHDDKTSDEGGRALEVIRKAAEAYYSTSMDENKAVLSLLGRSWFQRVWVLQEIAAARHILIACHSAEIDGHAFSSGLTALKDIIADKDMRDQIGMTVFLIMNATLRPKRVIARSDKISLRICPLEDLTTMYNSREATDHRDKVYALLGMSSDNYGPAAILPDYTVPWKDVLCRLIRLYIGGQACVQTWDDEDVAMIRGKGCVLGVVRRVAMNPPPWKDDDTWNNCRDAFVTIQMTGEVERGMGRVWKFCKWPGLIKRGNIVCLLQGASKPTLIRPCGDYCAVVTVGFVPLNATYSVPWPQSYVWGKLDEWNDLLQSVSVYPRDFLLVWNWQKAWRSLEDREDRRWLMDSQLPEQAKRVLEAELPKLHRLRNLEPTLVDSENFEQALENFPQALALHGPEAEEAYLPTFTAIMNITMSCRTPRLSKTGEELKSMMDIIQRRGDFVVITEETMTRIARSPNDGVWLMRFLLTQRGDEVPITEKMLEEAASNRSCGDELITVMLDRKGPEIPLTDRILLAAAENTTRALYITKAILDRRRDEVHFNGSILTVAKTK